MEYVWILAALCSGFVVANWLLLSTKSPMARVLARSTTKCGQRPPTR